MFKKINNKIKGIKSSTLLWLGGIAAIFAGIIICLFGISIIQIFLEELFVDGEIGTESIQVCLLFLPISLGGAFLFILGIFMVREWLARWKEKLTIHVTDEGISDIYTDFRADYAEFLQSDITKENPAVQNDVTQVFRNILQLRQNRLKKLGVQCHFKSSRKQHSESLSPVRPTKLTDGKYEIQAVTEDIAALTEYFKGNRRIYSQTDNEIAHYTVISACQRGDGTINCPNCGASQTREQLLDGCDYCKTKFMVEDLEEKISDFALRSDYDLQYNKYRDTRKKFIPYIGFWTWLVGFLCSLLFSILDTFLSAEETADFWEDGFFLTALLYIVPPVWHGLVFAFFAVLIFVIFVFPLIQSYQSIGYIVKMRLDKHKPAEWNNWKIQKQIREFDSHFSIAAFCSNVQNKITAVHFAETEGQINAFAASDLSPNLGLYKDVIDVQTDDIMLQDYTVSEGLQKASVQANVRLLVLDGKKCNIKNETVKMLFTKSAECKTQVVCAPSVLRCRKCGASLSLLEGKRCAYCGNELNLEQYDWVIREYKYS